GHLLRLDRVAALEVSVDGNVDAGRDLGEVTQHLLERDPGVAAAAGPGEAGAGGGERREAKLLQVAGAARIPGIGNDEAAALVQLAKRRAFAFHGGGVRDAGAHDASP